MGGTLRGGFRPVSTRRPMRKPKMVQSIETRMAHCTGSSMQTGWPITLPDPRGRLQRLQERVSATLHGSSSRPKNRPSDPVQDGAGGGSTRRKDNISPNCPAMYCSLQDILSNKQTLAHSVKCQLA